MPLFIIEHHVHHHYPDSESSTLTPLLQKMMETFMAQIDDLMSVLTTIHDDVTNLLAKAQGLEAQLTQLQQSTPPQVDLQPAIDAATAIREQLEGTAAATGSASGATDAEAQQLGEAAGTTGDASASTNDTTGSAGSADGQAASADDSVQQEAAGQVEGAAAGDAAAGDGSASEQPAV